MLDLKMSLTKNVYPKYVHVFLKCLQTQKIMNSNFFVNCRKIINFKNVRKIKKIIRGFKKCLRTQNNVRKFQKWKKEIK